MTNGEKYEEVFGVKPDTYCCPTIECSECPADNWGSFDCASRWWNSEYKEKEDET